MISALIRLLVISCSTVFLMILALFSIRQMGLQQSFSAPVHPWFEMAQWSIYSAAPDELCSPDFAPASTTIVVLPAQYNENQWRTPCQNGQLTLLDFLSSAKHPNWLLNPIASETTYLDSLVKAASQFDQEKKFAVMSQSQHVARFLRKKAPQWLFAADPIILLRLELFESLWIETALDFWPDFVISPFNNFNLGSRASLELARRKKRIIWNASVSGAQPNFNYQGIMTTRPSAQ